MTPGKKGTPLDFEFKESWPLKKVNDCRDLEAVYHQWDIYFLPPIVVAAVLKRPINGILV
jgi:hypothetical protein